jgi:hypothetical protein
MNGNNCFIINMDSKYIMKIMPNGKRVDNGNLQVAILLSKYIDNLNFEYIRIPNTIDIYEFNKSLHIKQEFIHGQSLKYYLYSANKFSYLDFYELILTDILKLYSSNPDIRIDSNLDNFLVLDKYIYFVDLTPPIFLSKMKPEKNNYEKKLFKLYYSIEYQIIAFTYYYLKPLIYKENKLVSIDIYKKCLDVFYHKINVMNIPQKNNCEPFDNYLFNLENYLRS